MPANLKDLKSRIKSVKSTQQITKAMKLVSTAKLGRAQIAVAQSRFYSKAIRALFDKLSAGDTAAKSVFMSGASSDVALVIVMSSERGLCGGYNANMAKLAIKSIEDLSAAGKKVSVLCIGKKAFQVLVRRRAGFPAIAGEPKYVSFADLEADPKKLLNVGGVVSLTSSLEKPTAADAEKVSKLFATMFADGQFGELHLLFSRFQSAMTQIPTADLILPVKPTDSDVVAAEPLYEESKADVLDSVLPRYISNRFFQALLEACASEHGARMSAMDSATRNGKEMEQKLQITYQRARQAAITNELIEIISGAEAI